MATGDIAAAPVYKKASRKATPSPLKVLNDASLYNLTFKCLGGDGDLTEKKFDNIKVCSIL